MFKPIFHFQFPYCSLAQFNISKTNLLLTLFCNFVIELKLQRGKNYRWTFYKWKGSIFTPLMEVELKWVRLDDDISIIFLVISFQ